jgi:hypothetical protein
VVWFGEPVLDADCLAGHVETPLTQPGRVPVAGLLDELDAIVGRDRINAVRKGLQQVFEELPRCPSVGFVDKLSDRKVANAVDPASACRP